MVCADGAGALGTALYLEVRRRITRKKMVEWVAHLSPGPDYLLISNHLQSQLILLFIDKENGDWLVIQGRLAKLVGNCLKHSAVRPEVLISLGSFVMLNMLSCFLHLSFFGADD